MDKIDFATPSASSSASAAPSDAPRPRAGSSYPAHWGLSLLHQACIDGDAPRVAELIAEGAWLDPRASESYPTLSPHGPPR